MTASPEKSSFLAPGIQYGLIAAAGMTASLLLSYALGLHTKYFSVGAYTDGIAAIILVAALWRMLHQLLYAANRYWLPVWVGLLHGLFASLIAAMGFYIAFSLYLHFINPSYPDLYLEWRFAQMRAAGQPESEIGTMARAFRWSMGPTGLPVTILGFYLLVGTIASPILTLWLNWRRKEVVNPR